MNSTSVTLYGFPVSTYVNIARFVLTHKGVLFRFHDLSAGMGGAAHLKLHPFDRVPVLRHDDFIVYETSAIVTYVDTAFEGPPLQPSDAQACARMHQWISAVNGYFYPYMIYHLVHERLVFPALGIEPDEKVVAASLPKIGLALDVFEKELQHGFDYIVGPDLTLADFFMLPSLSSLARSEEGAGALSARPTVEAWRRRMDALPSVQAVRDVVMPHVGKPLLHARRWVDGHRPQYN